MDDRTVAYIDFRKEHSGSTKGRRFAKQGEDFIDDPDDTEVLRRFKDERDRLFEQMEKTEENPVSVTAGDQSSKVFDFIKNIVGSDVLEIFGDTGAGKSKFVHALAFRRAGNRG